ncbi:MAG: lamin tail domain-containing protein [Limisphaerales bacterium]
MSLFIALEAHPAQVPANGLLREVWEGIGGVAVSDLLASPDYPDRPTSTNYVTDLFESPTDVLDDYGQRMHGYVVAPKTGNYTFWIATDDGGSLWLSTDANPANAREIASVAGWTPPREWNREANQRSEPIALTAGRIYYVSALMKEQGGGDNLAVRWLMPDGTDQAPIVATNLLPYGISFSAPTIATHPANTTVVEGGTARFEVRLSTVGLYTYRWQRNGTAISGAEGPELSYGPVTLADNNSRFRSVVTNTLGATTSNEGVLTVTPDTTRPTLVSALNLGLNQVELTFSEAVAAPSATTPANYQLSGGVTVSAVTFGASPNLVRLTTSALTFGTTYTLRVSHVRDRAQTPNTILENSQLTFVATDFAPMDIGNPPVAGSATPVGDGVEVRGSGDIGGTADSLQFAWQQRTGDFDLRTQLMSFDPTDPFAKAGLMARETFAAGSRFAAALATPATVGSFFLARSTANATANRSGTLPGNYPETWLRLKRAGNVFTGYGSFDGQVWTELGNVTLSLPASLYVGLAASSRHPTALATAAFRQIGTVNGGSIAPYTARGEVLGPSSRQTPLVISEIMYHPRPQPGRNAEFVELYNADLIAQDLTGHRISGSVDFAFPDGFVLPAGGFVVIAREPAQVTTPSGQPALGPFEGTNSLPNDSGTVRLRNPRGAILLEVNYGSESPWPVSADGAGHSLVLARPSYGEADPRAWAASAVVDGSPGRAEMVYANPLASVRINEFLAHTDDPQLDFVELFNASTSPVDVSGYYLTDDPTTNRFQIPAGTIITPRGFVSFDQNELGFALNAAGESLYLRGVDSDGQGVVLDAVRFDGQENGVATGRYPDGAPEFRRLTRPTPSAENEPFLPGEVVINELLFNPLSGDSADEFVELYNRAPQAVDLSGWRFTDGIDYTFPAGTTLAAQGYLAVAKDRVRLLANHPSVNAGRVFGDFDGTLANGGERVALAKPDWIVTTNEAGLRETNRIFIDVTEVRYGTGGRWGQWSDGLGSSLELIDPDSDPLRPSNWADSDESAKAPWSTIEFTGRLDNGDGGPADRLHLMLQGAGECLVDNVEVLPSGGANRLTNPSFDAGPNGWTIQGNHRLSARDTAGGIGNSACLHVRSPGRGDTAVNRIWAPVTPSLADNSTATLRARVRWLKGWPEFMLRLRGNYLEAVGRLAVPANLGTPAARNSRAVDNAGPAIFDVVHSPVVPDANQPVLVTARLSDPDGLGTVRLRWRPDPGTTVSNVTMRDDGTAGDALAGDGIFTGQINGRSAGSMVAFYVEAADTPASGAVTTRFPADAPTQEGLVRWGDSKPFGNLGVYRLWQRRADYDWLRSREPMANDNVDCTFVHGDGRVIYNAQMRGKGSPWHGGSVGGDYLFAFPDDDRLLGARDMALVTVGNLGSDDSAQREQAAYWIGRQMGLPVLHRRHVFFFENGAQKQTVYEDTEEPNGLYADRWWSDGENGDLYKVEDWFEFNDAGNSFTFSRDATLQPFTTTGGAYKQARYRWAWRKRAVVDSANNYTNLFNVVTALNLTGASYVPRVENLVDVENWLGIFALQHIVGNWDAYGYNRGKNAYIYKPVNGRFGMVPWDIDFVLGSGSDGTGTDIFGSNDPTVTRMWDTPTFRRVYLRAYLEALAGPLQSANFDPIVDGRFAALAGNGVNVANPTAIKTWVASRRNYLANRVAGLDTRDFSIKNNGGSDFNSAQTQVTLTGAAPLAVKTLTLNGASMPVTWTSTTNWSMIVPLGARTNVLQIAGLDSSGHPYAGATDSVTVTFTGGELPSPAGRVVIHEIMYHPRIPGASFIELRNISVTSAFDLSGWRLNGVGYTFPDGTVLGPGAYAVIVANRDAFAAAYGFGVLPVGEFPGTLQNNGERLTLLKPGATPDQDLVVDEVRYDSEPPWPSQADGFGPSLQLVDAFQDNWSVGNWAAAALTDTVQFTPGAANSVARALSPFAPVYLNEVLPGNVAGLADRLGDRDPWIELHNAGDTVLDLSGLYLTADYTNLTQWAFPAGATIGPKQFLVIWADGEPAESTAGEWHTGFRLSPTNGSLALVRLQNGVPAVMDHLNYREQPSGLSFGSYPDGQPRERQLFHLPTPGLPNNPATPPVQVFVNEWMASNGGVVLDPADNDADDWFELYNSGGQPVNLSAYTLTDDLANKAKFVIPNGTVIPAGGFLLVWADQETGQTTNGQLHVNFALSGGGESIGLFTPDGEVVDAVTFAAQTSDVSEGRFPDGMIEPFVSMVVPSPGQPNQFATANQPPVLGSIGNRSVDEGQTVGFTATATNAEAEQRLRFELLGAPATATLNATTGAFSWLTTEADGPGEYSFAVRVTDDGVPSRFDSETITVTVREVNQAPTLDPIVNQTVDEGMPLNFLVVARDADLPAQALHFSLEPGAPAGATIAEMTGALAWTPAEVHGEGTHSITVRVADNFQPPGSTTRTFQVLVREVDNPPVFSPVGLQTTDELAPFALQLSAMDPDSPPRAMRYSLETSPSGLQLNADTGQVTWTPAEVQGPGSFNVVVRASEVGGALSATLAFSIVVNEVNQSPVLAEIPMRVVGEGTLIVLTNTATDADLPAQRLSYTLESGAPAGASVDPQTGVFTWSVGGDVGPSTNAVTVRVSDDALEAKSASRTFTVVVVAEPRVVINEIMYQPTVSGGEYVELHNSSTNVTWDLSGWRLIGASYQFPAGTRLAPGAFLAVARHVAQFQTAYGPTAPVVGNFTNQLAPEGGVIELYRSSTLTPETRVDRVDFRNRAPWPVAANGGGASLQLIDPRQDNSRVANWSAVVGQSTNAPRNLIPIEATWRYWQSAADPAAGWTNRVYNDAAWPSGKALLYAEDAPLPAAKNTPLTLGPMSFYFRTTFQFDGNPEGASLQLSPVIDDGAVFYLNGKPILWLGMPENAIPARTDAATRTVSDAIFEGPFVIPVDNLRTGDNVLAVQLHQTNPGSSDLVMGLSVEVIEVRRESFTPGYVNSVRGVIEPFPQVGLNEVLAANNTGLRDNAGDRDPWIELANRGATPVALSGWYLSDSYATLTRWAFPAGAGLEAGQFKLVWADAEPAESTALDWHTGFRLTTPAGVVVLSRMQNGQAAVVDFLEYSGLSADQSFGYASPYTVELTAGPLPAPTPGASNDSVTPPPVPEVFGVVLGGQGQATVSWSSVAGRHYRLLVKNDLNDSGWQTIGDLVATDSRSALTDNGNTGLTRRFYSVALLP